MANKKKKTTNKSTSKSTKDNNKLTARQERFCHEYVKSLNATRAYMAAYPNITKENTAKAAGSRLLANVNVKSYIDCLLKEIDDNSIADAKEVMKYLTKGMRQELEEESIITEMIGNGCSKAKIIKKKISLKDANKCAEMLAKRYALLTDKIDATADVNTNITFNDDLDDLDDIDKDE